jgi:hypothetical protein
MAQALVRPTHINTSATTIVRVGMGMLLAVTINTRWGGAGSTATLYDSITGSGTVIGVIDLTFAMGTLFYEIILVNGLTVVTAGATPGDLTILTD